eukprot:6395340-Lingulodinium_polyedra.AAC.1
MLARLDNLRRGRVELWDVAELTSQRADPGGIAASTPQVDAQALAILLNLEVEAVLVQDVLLEVATVAREERHEDTLGDVE